LQDKSSSALRPEIDTKPRLLLVDDDPLIVDSLSIVLQEDYDVLTAETRKQANTLLQSLDDIPSLALIDLGLPPKPHSPVEGFALVNDLVGLNTHMKILVLSGQDEEGNIRHALTLGAVDFIPKPCDTSLLRARLQHQLMMLEAERVQKDVTGDREKLLGESPAIQTLRSLIQQFAETPFPVLIEGESGSGKELVAGNLHRQSKRTGAAFMTLNCAAFSKELLEAQLFGHSKGAFTGAERDKAGFFEEASEGSLFLDEIGELPLDLQAKLLRVLENGEYYRVGETRARKSNARIIAATNRNLKESVRRGEFREDLYHRLSVLTINVPPLHDRGDDIFRLLDHFTDVYSTSSKPFRLTDEAKDLLSRYSFPGNIRELRNIVIRLGAKYPGRDVGAEELNAELEQLPAAPEETQDINRDDKVRQDLLGNSFNLDETLQEWERQYINTALELSAGNLSKAARLLGVNRTTLYSRIEKFSGGDGE